MKKPSRKTIVRNLDKLVKEIVLKRDGGQCVCCWSKDNLQPGHLFTRQVYATRWSLDNVFAQCRSCNLRHEYDPFPLTNYFIKKFGQPAYEELHKRFWKPKPMKTFQLIELYEELKKL